MLRHKIFQRGVASTYIEDYVGITVVKFPIRFGILKHWFQLLKEKHMWLFIHVTTWQFTIDLTR